MTSPPDVGMRELIGKMTGRGDGRHVRRDEPEQAPPAAAPGGGALELMAGLAVSLDANTAALQQLARQQAIGKRLWDKVHPVPINTMQSAAAGTIQDPDRLGPQDGWAWRINWVSVTMGTGATQWTIWDTQAQIGSPPIQSTVTGVWEPKHEILMPGQNLTIVSVGGGVTITGQALEVDINFLAEYLGAKGYH